jgi:hypothetical protein
MDIIPLRKAELDTDTVLHIEVSSTPDADRELVRLFPRSLDEPIELYLDTEDAIQLAVQLGLNSDS